MSDAKPGYWYSKAPLNRKAKSPEISRSFPWIRIRWILKRLLPKLGRLRRPGSALTDRPPLNSNLTQPEGRFCQRQPSWDKCAGHMVRAKTVSHYTIFEYKLPEKRKSLATPTSFNYIATVG